MFRNLLSRSSNSEILLGISRFLYFLLFAFVPVFFWKSDAPWSGFEWPKTTLFSVIVILAFIPFFLQWVMRTVSRRSIFFVWGWIFVLWITYCVHVFLWAESGTEFLGVPPFYMAYPSYIGLLLLFFWTIQFPGFEYWINRGIRLGVWLVIGYALVQYVWLDPITYTLPFPDNRIFSTLWNPNSLAIYLLLAIPFIWEWLSRWYAILGYLILLWILWLTGSWSILALATFAWALFLLYRASAPWYWHGACLTILLITALQILFWSGPIGEAKYLSLLTRFEIWYAGYTLALHNPSSLIFWLPESLVHSWLNELRWVELTRYVPIEYRIEHFHSTWIDLYFRFWIVGWTLLILFIVRLSELARPGRSRELRNMVGILFLAAGIFHHMEIAHWMLLMAAFQWNGTVWTGKKKSLMTQKISEELPFRS